jgi:glycosyltransferase involved in cell wall biosynthesis
VTAPGLATAAKRLDVAIRAAGRLRERHPSLRLVIAGGVDASLPIEEWAREAGLGPALTITGRLDLEDFVRHIVASDVVLALRFPSHGEISGALVRALGVGRPALVTAGTPAAEEFPEGIVAPIDPGAREADELASVLDRLLADPGLREAMGRLAREHVRDHHDIAVTTARLARFLKDVLGRKDELLANLAPYSAPDGSLLAYLLDEIRWSALDLGLDGVPPGVETLIAEVVAERR